MAVPTWTVEIAFASDPLSTSPTWVDVSAYVLVDGAGPGITIERGRQSPLDDFRTGRASFRLRNTDRRFDPLYSSGPYFGQLLPGKQVRIRATANAVTTDQFRGFVRGWPQSFDDAGKWAYVDVECYDGLGWLSEARATADPVYDYANTIGTSLTDYYRSATATRWLDVATGSNVMSVVTGAGLRVSSDSILPGVSSSSSVAGFDGTTALVRDNFNAINQGAVSCWFRTTNTTATQTMIGGLDGTERVAVSLSTAGAVVVRIDNSTTGTTFRIATTTRTGLNDGNWHHLVVVDAGTAYEVYVDGVLDNTTESLDPPPLSATLHFDTLGARRSAGLGTFGALDQYFTGDLLLPMVWSGTLTAAQVGTLYALADGEYLESTTARTGRILDAVGWPSAWRDLTATPAGMCTSAAFNNAQATTLLREVAATEQGRLFAAKGGNLTLHARYYVNEATRGNTIQATFSDDGADIAYQAGGYDQDVDDILNDVTVTLKSGASSNSTNSASITAYGRKSDTINTLLPDLTTAASMAAGVVTLRKDVLTRFTPVQPARELTGANWSTVLGLEIGDRVRLEMTPGGVGSQLQQSATVEGVRIRAQLSHTDLEVVAAPIPAASWFRLDTSALDGTDLLGF